jgi:hypothetical protein
MQYTDALEALRKDKRLLLKDTPLLTARDMACDAMSGIIRSKKTARFLIIIREPDDRVRWKDHMKTRLGEETATAVLEASTISCASRMRRLTLTAWDMIVFEQTSSITNGRNELSVSMMTAARVIASHDATDTEAGILTTTFGTFRHTQVI